MATWSTSYVNDLPDSCFLYVAPGGKKDAEGKTTPRSLRYFPVKDANGTIDMPHLRNALARIPQSSLPQSVKDQCVSKAQAMMKQMGAGQASADTADGDLFRAVHPGLELRDAPAGDGMPTLVGHFARFNEWTEINSVFEGRFLERFAPGAFTKTLKENRSNMRVLFQHGRDPQVGDKPLGPIGAVREDGAGVAYEVPLLDTSYNRDLIPGLQAGLYGASFRFKVVKEEMNQRPKRSAANPDGLPERTVTEAKVMEFGPVTFPAYQGATADVRSITDRFVLDPAAVDAAYERISDEVDRSERLLADLRVKRTLLEELRAADTRDKADDGEADADDEDRDTHKTALDDDGAADQHSDGESRDDDTHDEALDAEAAPTGHSSTPSRASRGTLATTRRPRYTLIPKEAKPSWLL